MLKRLSVVILALVLPACTVSLSGSGSMFKSAPAQSEADEMAYVRALLLLGQGGEDSARDFLRVRGYDAKEIEKRIEAAKAAEVSK